MATTPRGMTLVEAYRSYREGLFIVNRTYQRKLVWTLDEKIRFIDSILRRYPTPLILLLQNGGGKYEIIDGMQRLNAIFSFIENAYPLADGRYFNVEEFLTAKVMAEEGFFVPKKSDLKLSPTDCATILDYQLAVTIFSIDDESGVTDIFGRINSGGKQLSPQEQRQAGVVTNFATFVRKLSSELRGDTSAEKINLAEMPTVSIDAPSLKLDYGVHAEQTFWCKQGILRTRELRDSYDEQTIADLAASVLLNEPFAASRERLDEVYDTNTETHDDLNNRLTTYPAERLQSELKSTFSVLVETIEVVDGAPNTFRKFVNPSAGGNPVRTPFYAVFMAFFQLIIREQKEPVDPNAILQALAGLAKKLETASHHINQDDRNRNIDLTIGLIQKYFVHKEPSLLSHGLGLAIDFENSLRRSKIETPRYEFKQGLYSLSSDRTKNKDLVPRLAEIACSIANIASGTNGYIYLGVADNSNDASRVEELDGVPPVKVGDTYVVGVDREARLAKQTVEEYVRNLVAEFRYTDLSEPLKNTLLSAVDTIQYRGLSVIRLFVPGQSKMSWVGEKSFVREGSETKEATPRQAAAIMEKFNHP
ncbi:MAG: DUF262 domain-containing protein [Gammaproteobacteria bacterium]|nr:DUF262 domain-containing protein [Gammaproteobacteria bacterium]NNJ84040.1 DUF262 domain-containing protein [Gammaproteobacteria bacterium]